MTSPSPDYCAVLQVPRGASQQEIARAYRALMRRHHPDVAGEDALSGPWA
jgi:DnaJ-class molecular chaperone